MPDYQFTKLLTKNDILAKQYFNEIVPIGMYQFTKIPAVQDTLQ
jgi:hypothetical protein